MKANQESLCLCLAGWQTSLSIIDIVGGGGVAAGAYATPTDHRPKKTQCNLMYTTSTSTSSSTSPNILNRAEDPTGLFNTDGSMKRNVSNKNSLLSSTRISWTAATQRNRSGKLSLRWQNKRLHKCKMKDYTSAKSIEHNWQQLITTAPMPHKLSMILLKILILTWL